MKQTAVEWLSFRLTFIFNFYTQQELAEILKIGQWKLLEKMKDKSFTPEELLQVKQICNELSGKK